MASCSEPGCANKARRRGLCDRHEEAGRGIIAPRQTGATSVAEDLKTQKFVRELTSVKTKYTEALKTIETQQQALEVLGFMQENSEPVAIEPHFGKGTSEATPVVVASDWHAEELVTKAQTSGLNEANPEIIERRITNFFQASLRLVKLLRVDVKMKTMVLALLGDFITNQIHGAENAENNAMGPTDAIVWVQNQIVGGIEFYLDHSDLNLVIICKVGNHARTTLKTRFSAENSHSLEYLMYRYLEAYFRGEERVTFVIDNGYHTYLPIFGEPYRFHHGHAVNYGGGVGGLTIPANKAIASWNQGRAASLDVFGHFHQRLITRRFACNGSLIGYNGYALSIKAEFEPPMQNLMLIDKKRGKTCDWPILLER